MKLTGVVFFAAAGIYIAAAKPLDSIALSAITACAALAGISLSKHSGWAAVGGALLIAGSLFLQSVMNYRCMDCLKADILILAGVVSLSVIEKGSHKKTIRLLAATMAVMMFFTLTLHNDGIMAASAENSPDEGNQLRYLPVRQEGRDFILDTAVKPVLLFTPTCGPCQRAVEAMVKKDPQGRLWTAVQVRGGHDAGREFLRAKGYTGNYFTWEWNGPVPALVVTRDGKTVLVHSPEEMGGLLAKIGP